MDHKVIEIWQERAGEYSFRCMCGHINKHQPFRRPSGEVRCGGETQAEWDALGLLGMTGRCTICKHRHEMRADYRHPCHDCLQCDALDARRKPNPNEEL